MSSKMQECWEFNLAQIQKWPHKEEKSIENEEITPDTHWHASLIQREKLKHGYQK